MQGYQDIVGVKSVNNNTDNNSSSKRINNLDMRPIATPAMSNKV